MGDSSIKAVLDDDFVNLLKRLGKYDSIIAGEEKCFFCNTILSLDNITMVFPRDNKVCFCCDKTACTEKLLSEGNCK